MPLVGSFGTAAAKGFGFTSGGSTAVVPWTYVQTNADIGSSTVNYGKNFGTNSVPKGTLIQYNNSNFGTYPSGNAIYIPQTNNWKPFYVNYFITGSNTPSLNSNGWTNNLYPGSYPGTKTSVIDALLTTPDIQYGSYVGNGTTGRTIPHTLLTYPGVVMCMSDGYHTGGFRYKRSSDEVVLFEGSNFTNSFFNDSTPTTTAARSSWSTTTTFKVPDSCNVSGRTYYYVAYASSGTTVYCGDYNVAGGTATQNIGFEFGTLITKGSNGGNYAWHNPVPYTRNSQTSYFNGFWAEDGSAPGQSSATDSWLISTTGFTAPNVGNSWYGAAAGVVYYYAIRKSP